MVFLLNENLDAIIPPSATASSRRSCWSRVVSSSHPSQELRFDLAAARRALAFQPPLWQIGPVSDEAPISREQHAGLSREQILAALTALNQALATEGLVGEVCRFGGAVMVLAFNARLATKDVDAVFQPAAVVRRLAAEVADQAGLPAGWLNDGVKGFLSARHDLVAGSLPQYANLRLTMPVPEYLLAMKCMAARVGIAPGEGALPFS